MLRELRPDLRIGFFLHIPFPPPELFMQLPRRAELLRGMLGADLVGFQRPQAAHNFAQLATRLLGAAPPTTGGSRSTAGWSAPARSRSRSTSPRWQALAAGPTWSAGPASCAPTSATRAGAAQRRPARLHQGHRAPAQGVQRAAAPTAEVKVRDTVLVQVAVPSRERVEQLPDPARPDRARGRPDQRRVRPGRRAGDPLPATSRSTGPSWPRSTGPPT